MLSTCDCTQSWIVKRVATTNDKKKTCNPVASHHLLFTNKWPWPWLQHQLITMEFIQSKIPNEFNKEIINWQWVCMLFQNNQPLCWVRDDWGFFPLHYTCYQNAPLESIQFFIRIWPQAMGRWSQFILHLLVSLIQIVPHWRLHVMLLHQMRSSHI